MKVFRSRYRVFYIILGLISFFSACNNYSVSEEQAESFIKYYPVSNTDNTGTKIIQNDGGYAILCNYLVPGQKDIFIIITDEFGRHKKGSPYVIDTDFDDHGYSMIWVNDGYIICGTSVEGSQRSGYLVKVSHDGRFLWDKRYSEYEEMEFRNIARAQGDLILTGYGKEGSGNREVILFKTTANGDSLLLKKRYPFMGHNSVGEAIIEYQERYHILITTTNVNTPDLARIRMLNTNINGGGLAHYWIEIEYLSGRDIALNTAGNMFILGNIEEPNSKISSKIYLAELEMTGSSNSIYNIKNSTVIPDLYSLYATSFAPINEDALAIGGWELNKQDKNILFLQVGINFEVQTKKTYGSNLFQAAESIIFTDPGFALAGSVNLGGGRTSTLLKIDQAGELR